jgi:predicted RNA binding protein YcfA (HicA-like mRNA interferase family)
MGFEVLRQHGSHIRMARGQTRLTVPNHETIAPKTLQAILRQAGISLNEFLNQL